MKPGDELKFMVALSLLPQMGPVRFNRLLEQAGSIKKLSKHTGLVGPRELEAAEVELEKARRGGTRVIHVLEPSYPSQLKQIHDPPIVIYVKGRLPRESAVNIAVVGSRTCSLYGRKMAHVLSRDLAGAGVNVISGMALGIDTAAHEGALKAGGTTVAVLGGGIAKLYPSENRKLAEKIAAEGALVSEYPMDMPPLKQYFPLRNRIISGLSQGVLVVEAKRKSGALITAAVALSQNRDVYAVPGNADSLRSEGTNDLIRQGARLVASAQDIFDDLDLRVQRIAVGSGRSGGFSPEEDIVLRALNEDNAAVDDIIERTQLPSHRAISALSSLELKGAVRQSPGKYYTKCLL